MSFNPFGVVGTRSTSFLLWQVHEWDVRESGKLHVSLDFDGVPFVVHGEFVVVDPPHRLRYRWSNDEMIEVTIEPHGASSRPRLAHTFRPGPEGAVRTQGWTCRIAGR